jgi:hypothetical protein
MGLVTAEATPTNRFSMTLRSMAMRTSVQLSHGPGR